MKSAQLTIVLMMLAVSWGCQSTQNQTPLDPYFRSPTVPPPGTGSYTTGSAVGLAAQPNPPVMAGPPPEAVPPASAFSAQPAASTTFTPPPENAGSVPAYTNPPVSAPPSGSVTPMVPSTTQRVGDEVKIPVAAFRNTTGAQVGNDFAPSGTSQYGSIASSSASHTVHVSPADPEQIQSQPAQVYGSQVK